MLPLSHLCEELAEQRRMRGHSKRLADDLAAGGCRPPAAKKPKKSGGGGGGGNGKWDLSGWC
jgi:hypothetical protein